MHFKFSVTLGSVVLSEGRSGLVFHCRLQVVHGCTHKMNFSDFLCETASNIFETFYRKIFYRTCLELSEEYFL